MGRFVGAIVLAISPLTDFPVLQRPKYATVPVGSFKPPDHAFAPHPAQRQNIVTTANMYEHSRPHITPFAFARPSR
jgi:hypothetical protein